MNSNGQIRIIEAFFAVLIVFGSFAVSANLSVRRNTTKTDDLTSVGLQALLKLDSEGTLAKHIDDKNWTALQNIVNLVLPTGITFNLTVYDEQMQQLNTAIISNGAFNSREIVFVEYVCASQSPVFRCYKVHLYLAVAG